MAQWVRHDHPREASNGGPTMVGMAWRLPAPRVSAEDLERLDAEAERQGVTRYELIRQAIAASTDWATDTSPAEDPR